MVRRGREDVEARWLLAALFVVLVLTLLAAKVARAEPAPGVVAPVAESMPASAPVAWPEDPVGLAAGAPAPFPGVLLPEARVLDYLGSRARLEECSVKLDVRDRELARVLAAVPSPAPALRWSFWPGVAVGLVVGVGVLFGASYLLSLAP